MFKDKIEKKIKKALKAKTNSKRKKIDNQN